MSLTDKLNKLKPTNNKKTPVICIMEDETDHSFSLYTVPKYSDSPYVKTMVNRIIEHLENNR